ncbi:MAG: NADH:ubiquinone oxidoreductase subunit NDUFA12 [Rickettsiales bacterium]|nr:NADH:ubiquinone oxidoreductase subunit NDUFA12 [Rickettsiales bacterium]
MTLGTKISTFFTGKQVGIDAFGNRYFTQKRTKAGARARRWVMYRGTPEPSKVPPLWNAWLHHTIAVLPSEMNIPTHSWQKEYIPNLTGTAGAYLPPGHIRKGADRAATVADYQAWTPLD